MGSVTSPAAGSNGRPAAWPDARVTAVARRREAPVSQRDRVRRTRLWALDGRLHLVESGRQLSWVTGKAGLTEVRWLAGAEEIRDRCAAKLAANRGGFVELPAQGNTPAVSLRLADWVTDADLLSDLDDFDPLVVTGIGPVLNAGGVSILPVPTRDARRRSPDATDFRREFAIGGTLIVAVVLSLVAFLQPNPSFVLMTTASGLAVAMALALGIPRARRRTAEQATRWSADAELRPAPGMPVTRGLRHRARIAAVAGELVVVGPARGELWLGREAGTGATEVVTVLDGQQPVRVELRRADGTSLVRLPWADWFAGDDGAALCDFARDVGLATATDILRPAWRARLPSAPLLPRFSSAETPYSQLEGRRLSEFNSGIVPGWLPGLAAMFPFMFATISAEDRSLPLALLSGSAIVICMGPIVVGGLRRWWERRMVGP